MTVEKLTTTTILGRQWQHKSTARELPHISTSERQPYQSHSEGHFQQSTIHNIDNNDITTIRVLGMPQISWERSPDARLSSLRFCDSDLGVHHFSKETDGRGWERIVFPGGVVGVTRALRVLCCTTLQLLGSRNIIIIQGDHKVPPTLDFWTNENKQMSFGTLVTYINKSEGIGDPK